VTHYSPTHSPVPLPTPSRAYMSSELRLGKSDSSIQGTRGSNPQVLNRNACTHTVTHCERGGNLKKLGNVEAKHIQEEDDSAVHDRRCSTQRTETHKVPLKVKNRRHHGQGSELLQEETQFVCESED
jgi:hypothetical protein